jgi:hypothetical protein
MFFGIVWVNRLTPKLVFLTPDFSGLIPVISQVLRNSGGLSEHEIGNLYLLDVRPVPCHGRSR